MAHERSTHEFARATSGGDPDRGGEGRWPASGGAALLVLGLAGAAISLSGCTSDAGPAAPATTSASAASSSAASPATSAPAAPAATSPSASSATALPTFASGSATLADPKGDGKGHADITQVRVTATGSTVEVWVDLAEPDNTSDIVVAFKKAIDPGPGGCPERVLAFRAGGTVAMLSTITCGTSTWDPALDQLLSETGTATTRHASFTTKEWPVPAGTKLMVAARAYDPAQKPSDVVGTGAFIPLS